MAFGTYKFTQRDAERIEQHTGVNPEELDDAELERAMSDLNIEPQKVTSADVEESAATPGSAAAEESPAALGDEIEKLAALRDQGILSDAEFEAAKRKTLGLD